MPCSPPLSRRASELASTTINKPTTDLKSPAPGTFVYNLRHAARFQRKFNRLGPVLPMLIDSFKTLPEIIRSPVTPPETLDDDWEAGRKGNK